METRLQYTIQFVQIRYRRVTILVLVETPLQFLDHKLDEKGLKGHNPCFSGNSFAIPRVQTLFTGNEVSQSLF